MLNFNIQFFLSFPLIALNLFIFTLYGIYLFLYFNCISQVFTIKLMKFIKFIFLIVLTVILLIQIFKYFFVVYMDYFSGFILTKDGFAITGDVVNDIIEEWGPYGAFYSGLKIGQIIIEKVGVEGPYSKLLFTIGSGTGVLSANNLLLMSRSEYLKTNNVNLHQFVDKICVVQHHLDGVTEVNRSDFGKSLAEFFLGENYVPTNNSGCLGGVRDITKSKFYSDINNGLNIPMSKSNNTSFFEGSIDTISNSPNISEIAKILPIGEFTANSPLEQEGLLNFLHVILQHHFTLSICILSLLSLLFSLITTILLSLLPDFTNKYLNTIETKLPFGSIISNLIRKIIFQSLNLRIAWMYLTLFLIIIFSYAQFFAIVKIISVLS